MITGLDHGTHYTIVVHASNNTGRGRDSTPVAITTNPTFPDAPTEVVMNEINSSFVELVVTLGGGDGGAPVTLVRVGYQPVSGEGVRTEVDTSLEPGVKNVTVSIEGLTPQTRYLLRASAMNWRGQLLSVRLCGLGHGKVWIESNHCGRLGCTHGRHDESGYYYIEGVLWCTIRLLWLGSGVKHLPEFKGYQLH